LWKTHRHPLKLGFLLSEVVSWPLSDPARDNRPKGRYTSPENSRGKKKGGLGGASKDCSADVSSQPIGGVEVHTFSTPPLEP